jgi:hypothetical protein
MRGRKEKLTTGLRESAAPTSKGAGRPAALFRRWLGPRMPEINSRNFGDTAFPCVFQSATLLQDEVPVVDGLGAFHDLEPDSIYMRGRSEVRAVSRSRVVELELPQPGKIRVRNQAFFREMEIRQLRPLSEAEVRTFKIESLASASVRALQVLGDVVYVKGDSRTDLIPPPIARDGTARMSVFPHVRRSLPVPQVSPEIVESFLQEARDQKEVPEGQGEFLAFFRRIPVASISRVRYLEDKAVLLYTLTPSQGSFTARLHDLAAIRDRSRGIVHLVVHRTRSCATVVR